MVMKNQTVKVAVVLCLTLLGICLSHAQQKLNNTAEDINTPAPRQPDSKLLTPLREIMQQLEKNTPELVQNLSPEETDKILQFFLNGFNCELSLTRTPLTAAPSVVDSTVYPVLKLDSGRLLYARLNSFSPSTIAALTRELKPLAAETQSIGLIIDLRQCSGYDPEQAIYLLGLLCPPQYLPANCGKCPERMIKKIIAVLVGPETSGSAEFFAWHLRESRVGLSFGAPSAGRPFRCKTVPLSDGRYLALPEFPSGLRKASMTAAVPLVAVSPQPIADYAKLKERGAGEDICLMRASDLVISIHEINAEWKNKR